MQKLSRSQAFRGATSFSLRRCHLARWATSRRKLPLIPASSKPGSITLICIIHTSVEPSYTNEIWRYLIHAPYGGKEGRTGAWRALVEAQQAGKIRSLGVSNYGVHHLNELEAYIKELEGQKGKGKGGEISVGQWELHPWLTRPDILDWCNERGVICEAYCPLVRGERFDDPKLQALAKKYSKTPAQILIRWSMEKVGSIPMNL